MKSWLEIQLGHIPPRGALAEAIRYALTRWDAMGTFLDDGRVELDTNTVEMDTSFCVEALEEALARFDKPEIFNTD
jgi:Transposase IS66 family